MMADLFDAGAAGAAAGMAAAIEHADRVEPGWPDRAYAAFEDYARAHDRFTSEAVRSAAEAAGLPLPPDMRSWGAVVRRASQNRIVVTVGYVTSANVQAHSRPIRVWRSLINSADVAADF